METIQLSIYEKKDLVEILKYAKEQKQKNKPIINIMSKQTRKFDTTDYDIGRIDNLLEILKSKKERITLKKRV